jgi:hypothetical protein
MIHPSLAAYSPGLAVLVYRINDIGNVTGFTLARPWSLGKLIATCCDASSGGSYVVARISLKN